jgi:hypothetical protein
VFPASLPDDPVSLVPLSDTISASIATPASAATPVSAAVPVSEATPVSAADPVSAAAPLSAAIPVSAVPVALLQRVVIATLSVKAYFKNLLSIAVNLQESFKRERASRRSDRSRPVVYALKTTVASNVHFPSGDAAIASS